MKQFAQVVGWYGVIAILAAYLFLSFGILGSKSYLYQLMNLSGALAIIYEASKKKDFQPVVLNIFWASIALISIFLSISK